MADDTSTSSPFGGLGWISGGSTGLTYEQLQQRRAIALALASRQKGFPKNKGEGMTYLGESIGDALQALGLQRSERQALAAGQRQPVVPGAPGAPGTGVVTPPVTAPPPPVTTEEDPKKTSEAVVPPVTTADNTPTDTGAIMQAATEKRGEQQGVPDLSQFAAADVSPDDFGSPATPAPFPPTLAQRFVGDQTPAPQQVASTVPPVSVDPNRAASLTGGNTISPAMMAFSQNAKRGSTPVPVPGTPLPQPRPDMPVSLANAPPEQGGYNFLDAQADKNVARQNAIGGIESGGEKNPYTTATSTGKGDVAYGRYQILGKEIPGLTEKYLGQKMTPAQFVANPRAQDAVFNQEFSDRLVGKYGEEGAAKAWYAGEQGMKNPNASDRFGRLTVAGYGQDYLRRLGDPNAPAVGDRDSYPGGTAQVATAPPQGGGNRDNMAALLMSQPDQAPQQPTQTASADDTSPDARLLDVAGANQRQPGSPFRATASLGRVGVATDAPQPGASPMGALDPTGSINARRDAITGTVLDQQRQPPVPEVPQPDPTQSGPTAPATSGAGSSNPPTVTDIEPAPPQAGAQLAQAAIPPGGYPSVPQPQLSRPQALPPTPPPTVAPSMGERPPPDPTVAAAPPPALTPQQLQSKMWLTPTAEEQHAAQLRQDPRLPFLSPTQREAQAAEATEFERVGKAKRDAYNASVQTENQRLADTRKAWEDSQRQLKQNAPKITGEQQLQNEAVAAAQRQGKLQQAFGPNPEAALTDLKLEKEDVNKSMNILRQTELAKTAIKEGIITGYGADMRLNTAKLASYMTANKLAGSLADNTEMFQNAVRSMLSTGVQTLTGADASGRPVRFNQRAIDIASGIVPADQSLQLESIQKIMSENERIAREKINNYEDKIQRKFRAFPEMEPDYQIPIYKKSTSDFDKRLFDSIGTPNETNTRDYYDRRFGTGAAELELARRARGVARGGGP